MISSSEGQMIGMDVTAPIVLMLLMMMTAEPVSAKLTGSPAIGRSK